MEMVSNVLRAIWVATIVPIILAWVPCSCLSSLSEALSCFAQRGKTMHSSSHSQKFRVPQRFFTHFYVLGAIWTTSLFLATWSYANKTSPFHDKIWCSVFLLLLLEVQVMSRLFDSFCVFKYSSSARMHFVGYLTGMCYYPAASVSLCCEWAQEVVKHAWNVGETPSFKMDFWTHLRPLLLHLQWYQWMGASIFIWGWIHQRSCHAILGSLRKRDGEESEKYKVPYGDWFELVSSPHYLAEIVIYFGLVVASRGADLTIWLLFGFVVANLVFAAAETQRWYLRTFKDYPRNRRIIFPFVY